MDDEAAHLGLMFALPGFELPCKLRRSRDLPGRPFTQEMIRETAGRMVLWITSRIDRVSHGRRGLPRSVMVVVTVCGGRRREDAVLRFELAIDHYSFPLVTQKRYPPEVLTSARLRIQEWLTDYLTGRVAEGGRVPEELTATVRAEPRT